MARRSSPRHPRHARPQPCRCSPHGAYLATLTDDRELFDICAEALRHRVVPGVYAPLPLWAVTLQAMAEWRWDDAADDAARGWARNSANGVLQGMFALPLVAAHFAAGRVDDTRRFIERWSDEIERLGNRPLHTATLHWCRAPQALIELDTASATRDAHALLDVAHANGYAFLVLDALEMIAEACDRLGQAARAAQLAGAAAAERERIGCLGRFRGVSAPTRRWCSGSRRRPSTCSPPSGERASPTGSNWLAGQANADIAVQLLISVPTVMSHLTHVFAKFGVSSGTELAAAAARRRGG